jgi:hypothetical protein
MSTEIKAAKIAGAVTAFVIALTADFAILVEFTPEMWYNLLTVAGVVFATTFTFMWYAIKGV